MTEAGTIANSLKESEDRLERVMAIARTDDGKIELFFTEADKDRMVVLLERAKQKLVRSME